MSEQVRELPAPRTTVARLVGVLTSPGETFQEISGRPSWMAPFFIYLVALAIGLGTYATKADWIAITTEQIESSPFMQLVPDAQRDEIVHKQTEGVRKLGSAHLGTAYVCNVAIGTPAFIFFLTLIYASLFSMVGALKDLKLGRAWGRFLLTLLMVVGYVIATIIANTAFSDSPSSSLLLIGAAAILVSIGCIWMLNGVASRDIEFHRMLSVCCYASAVLIIGVLALVVVSLVHEGSIGIGAEKLVPSSLGAMLKPENAVVRALFNSLDIFTIWWLIVLTIGFRAVTRLTMGMAASMTFLPWGLIVMIKIAWAAVFG